MLYSGRSGAILKAVACAVALTLPFAVTSVHAQSVAQVFPGNLGQMPQIPQTLNLPDWSQTASGFYSLALNPLASGTYLPLMQIVGGSSGQPVEFGLPAYVQASGAYNVQSTQALTDMGAVLGATMSGLNMTAYVPGAGAAPVNYVGMLGEFFDSNLASGVFGNNIHSADPQLTAWYTLFPDILAQSISDRYPSQASLATMAYDTALSWSQAVGSFGTASGYNFNYTGFNFSTMQPTYNGSWREPDMASGIAWLEYSAYLRWQNPAFLQTAKDAMSYLAALPPSSNPSYEVLAPFGTLAAAEMNATAGTNYPVQQMLAWNFSNYNPNRPGWGVEAASWGGQDVYGLVGQVTSPSSPTGGYAFYMETATQMMALAPLVKYEPQYAVAMGRWMLNAANAMRLFYGNYAPNQSNPGWSQQSLVSYEGLKYQLNTATQPLVATGDASSPSTEFGLYGASYVGVLGSIIKSTNVSGLLQFNLDVTDSPLSSGVSTPMFLFYNPYSITETVDINVGANPVNVFDSVLNSFIAMDVSGNISFDMAGGSAAVLSYIPVSAVPELSTLPLLAVGVIGLVLLRRCRPE
jgi:hypothetical protein